MSHRSPVDTIADPEAAATYIAALTGDLARIARRHGLQTLGYILDMARIEAETMSGTNGNGGRVNGQPRTE